MQKQSRVIQAKRRNDSFFKPAPISNPAVQSGTGKTYFVQRKLTFQNPTPVEKDPVPILERQQAGSTNQRDTSIGLTTPTFNGNLLTPSTDVSPFFIMNAPGELDRDNKATCKIDTSPINATVSAEELTIKPPSRSHTWTGTFATHGNRACKDNTNIPVTVEDGTATHNMYQIVLSNENEHVSDLKGIVETTNRYLDSIEGATASGKDQQECTGKLITRMRKGANPALTLANEFLRAWRSSVARRDSGSHTIKVDPPRILMNCSGIRIKIYK